MALSKNIRQITWHICTWTRNKQMSKWKHVNKKAGKLSDVFRKKHIGIFNVYCWIYIWYIVKYRWLWVCFKACSFLCRIRLVMTRRWHGKECTRTVYMLSLFRAKSCLYINQRLAAWCCICFYLMQSVLFASSLIKVD